MSISTTMNRDNSGLETWNAGDMLVGCVDEVNGKGAREVPEFVPTRAELLVLVRRWECTFLGRAYSVFCTRQIGTTDIRLCPFSERRIARILELLGDDAKQAVQEERDEFAKDIRPRKWKEFRAYLGPGHLHGDEPAGSAEPGGDMRRKVKQLEARFTL